MEVDSIIQKLRELLRIEEKEQERKWFNASISFKTLREEGAIIYPVKINNKSFGYNDFPVIQVSFHLRGGINSQLYKGGMPIALFNTTDNEICNGQLLSIEDRTAEILLYTEDFPDWIYASTIGIKRLPDNRTFQAMHGVLNRIAKQENKFIYHLFERFHKITGNQEEILQSENQYIENQYRNLNEFQLAALKKSQQLPSVQIIHGPPGTGKTTTLVAIIQALREQGKTVIASAPSNAAIDHLAKQLIKQGLKVLRLGNTAKVNEDIWQHTPEGILSQEEYNKPLKKLRIRADEFRKLAHQYKRNFGRDEREQRKLLQKEAHALREEIQSLSKYYLSSYFEKADVILGTPIGLMDDLMKDKKFDIAILDEAGQCIEPLAWLLLEKANHCILAGDHLQLPPTIISEEATLGGLNISILERAIQAGIPSDLLGIQYRMTPEIAEFSSRYFYEGKLKSVATSIPDSLIFYDTAGAGFDEKKDENSQSTYNPEEILIIAEHLDNWKTPGDSVVFISPYTAQVELAKEQLQQIAVSTIDSFQGQEADIIIVSLVRSNPEGKIGFLSDYRRMNVALTRAKSKLIVIGDSTTITSDSFYKQFVSYTEEIGAYHSVFELMY